MSLQGSKQVELQCLQQLKSYLLEFQSGHMDDILKNVELSEQCGKLSLINLLQIVMDFLKNQSYQQDIAEFIVAKCSNIINCLFFHRSATFRDYQLLYDIIYQSIKLQPQQEGCIVKIQKTISAIQISLKNQLIDDFLYSICMLLRIKLLDNRAFCERDKLKSFCLDPNVNRIVIDFALKLIKGKHIGQFANFSFFKMRIGGKAYNCWLQEATRERVFLLKVNKQSTEEGPVSQQNTSKQGNQCNEIASSIKNIPSKQCLHDWLSWLRSYKGRNYQQDPQVKEILNKIISLRIQQILKMNQYRDLVVDLLKLSFSYSELINFSISIGIFVMDVEEFIKIMRPMLDPKTIDQRQSQSLTKKIRKALQDSCGSQAAFLWKRLTSTV